MVHGLARKRLSVQKVGTSCTHAKGETVRSKLVRTTRGVPRTGAFFILDFYDEPQLFTAEPVAQHEQLPPVAPLFQSEIVKLMPNIARTIELLLFRFRSSN